MTPRPVSARPGLQPRTRDYRRASLPPQRQHRRLPCAQCAARWGTGCLGLTSREAFELWLGNGASLTVFRGQPELRPHTATHTPLPSARAGEGEHWSSSLRHELQPAAWGSHPLKTPGVTWANPATAVGLSPQLWGEGACELGKWSCRVPKSGVPLASGRADLGAPSSLCPSVQRPYATPSEMAPWTQSRGGRTPPDPPAQPQSQAGRRLGPGTPVIVGGDLLAVLKLGGGDRKHLEGM